MNKKLKAQNSDGIIRYCVLSGDGDLQRQLNEMYFGAPFGSTAFSVSLYSDRFDVIDTIAYDVVATFKILSIEDTNEDVCYEWTDETTLKKGWH